MLIQPPRLVEIDTSGAVVTIRPATSSMSPSRVSTLPKASWVETDPLSAGEVVDAGMGRMGRGGVGRLLMSDPTAAQIRPASESGSKRSHSVSAVSPSLDRKAAICSPERRAA